MLRRSVYYFGWSTADYALRAVIGFVVGVFVARYLGPADFGVYTICLAIVAIAGCLVPLASNAVVVRELVSRPESEHSILGAQFLLQAIGALLAFAVSVAAIWWQKPVVDGVFLLALIASAALLFRPFDAITGWFNAHLEGWANVLARLPAFLAMSAARLWLVYLGAPVVAFVATASVEVALGAAGLLVAYRLLKNRITNWSFDARTARAIFRDSWPLLIAGAATQLYMKIDVVMLGAMADQHEVGIYGVATRLSEVWYFIPTLAVTSFQPVIQRLRLTDEGRYRDYLTFLYAMMTWSAIAIAVPISFVATPLISLVFGSQFAESGAVLSVHIWAGIAVFLGIASSVFLLTENLPHLLMYRTMIGLVANVSLNAFLIPRWGAVGAAVATVISYFMAEFSLMLFASSRAQAVLMARSFSPFALLSLLQVAVGRARRVLRRSEGEAA